MVEGTGMNLRVLQALSVLLTMTGGPVLAQLPEVSIAENGASAYETTSGETTLPVSRKRDPGPGGLARALTFTLPYNAYFGDVILTEGTGNRRSDLIRFNGDNTLIFYSDFDVTDPSDAFADIGFPTNNWANKVTIAEVGTESFNGALYQPKPNQPGFNALKPTYLIISDIPEPSTLSLLVLAVFGSGIALRLRGYNGSRLQVPSG
ncbi:MAG: hypothetical protein JOY83_20670 [Alphaproteobacteria bacterium]|nr:hypothetical protein [Alphaproteobacteria bacterium]